MKCKGKIKGKTKNGRTEMRVCNYELSEHDIFCPKCGEPTKALSGPLSAKENWKIAWQEFKPIKGKYLPFSIFIILTAFLLTGLAVYFTNGKYWLQNAVLLFIVPLTLIPLSFESDFLTRPFTVGDYFKSLKHYPKYFLFVLINIIYFLLLKIICDGFMLNIVIDPILHLVRFIMVLYWIAIVVPAPILMIRRKMNPFKAVVVAYKAGSETRWQQFYIALFAFLANLVGAVLLGLGLLVTIPFTYIILERYYRKMDEFELFEPNIKSSKSI